jgi:hypothetical protein
VLGGVVVGEDGASLEAHAGVAPEVERVLDDHVRPGERFLDAAGVQLTLEADVVAELRVNHRASGKRLVHVDDDRQLFPFRLDQRDRILGLAARLGNHRRHRLALPARALDGDRVLRRRLDAL